MACTAKKVIHTGHTCSSVSHLHVAEMLKRLSVGVSHETFDRLDAFGGPQGHVCRGATLVVHHPPQHTTWKNCHRSNPRDAFQLLNVPRRTGHSKHAAVEGLCGHRKMNNARKRLVRVGVSMKHNKRHPRHQRHTVAVMFPLSPGRRIVRRSYGVSFELSCFPTKYGESDEWNMDNVFESRNTKSKPEDELVRVRRKLALRRTTFTVGYRVRTIRATPSTTSDTFCRS